MKMWGENSLCCRMDCLVIYNHRPLFITLPVCTVNLVTTVWDFAFIPWRANFLSRMPLKFWQLLELFLPLQEINELMKTDKRKYLLFPWRLTGLKASCFPRWDRKMNHPMLSVPFPQLSHQTSAVQSFWKSFPLLFWLHIQVRTSTPPLTWKNVPKCHFASSLSSGLSSAVISSLLTRKQNSMEDTLVTHLNHERQIWQLRFTNGALKRGILSVQPL